MTKIILLICAALFIASTAPAAEPSLTKTNSLLRDLVIITNPHNTNAPFKVNIRVDAAKELGAWPEVWRFFGADEPNYAYMKNGRKLLGELGELKPKQVYFRTHNLLCTGDGTPALKWGSTGVYREDSDGKPSEGGPWSRPSRPIWLWAPYRLWPCHPEGMPMPVAPPHPVGVTACVRERRIKGRRSTSGNTPCAASQRLASW